jgi:hypothetical protein
MKYERYTEIKIAAKTDDLLIGCRRIFSQSVPNDSVSRASPTREFTRQAFMELSQHVWQ